MRLSRCSDMSLGLRPAPSMRTSFSVRPRLGYSACRRYLSSSQGKLPHLKID